MAHLDNHGSDRQTHDKASRAPLAYACAGPSRIPEYARVLLEAAGGHFASQGYRLRCGREERGVSKALATGAGGKQVDIILPWAGYAPRADVPGSERIYGGEADTLAASHHPDWGMLRDSVRRCESARAARVAGGPRGQIAQFLLCWAPGGVATSDEIMPSTQEASLPIRVAAGLGVPVINIGRKADRKRIQKALGDRLPEGTSPSARITPEEMRSAFQETHAKVKAQREAEAKAKEKREKQRKEWETPVPKKTAAASKKTETAKRKEQEANGQGSLF